LYVLGIVSTQTINDPDLDITNRIFANKYHVIASRILRPNTVYKVSIDETVLMHSIINCEGVKYFRCTSNLTDNNYVLGISYNI
jgi:hypothetical protein